MATNLHALIRHRTIDRCLRDLSQTWDWSRLAEECELVLNEEMGIELKLSRRTIMYDIKHMKDGVLGYHAPIVYNRERKSYEYSDPDFSIGQAPLSKKTLEELNQVLLILRQFSGQEKLEGMGSIAARLEHGLNTQSDDDSAPFIHFEESLNAPGQKWVDILYQHIKKEECLSIRYRAFDKQPTNYIISPYILKEYNNRWFLFGFNHQGEYIVNLALDRIVEIKKSLRPYVRDKKFDPDVLFNDVVGVSLPNKTKVSTVLLEAYGKHAKFIATKPLHQSQRVHQQKKNRTIYAYTVIPNFELESKILSFADLVQVLAPKELRDKIAARLIAGALGYADKINKSDKIKDMKKGKKTKKGKKKDSKKKKGGKKKKK